ncbi:MAG: FG-GAP-like repeat-containing protein, partial [Bacteroidetes bacterium]|nr:FG-GAP-like repeat-containing protein [Bacteroidota bacterium]
MKKLLAISTVLISISCILKAQTNIPAGSVDGTWVKMNSPYFVNGNVSIDNNQTLIIEPGVQVVFTGYYKMEVQGRILAEGLPDDSIIFTVNDHTDHDNPSTTGGGWHGIKFPGTASTNDTSKFVYCRIEYSKMLGTSYGEQIGGALLVQSFNKVLISNSIITNNLANYGGGGIFLQNSSIIIKNSVISHNLCDGVWGPFGAGIGCTGSSPLLENVKILDNILVQGNGMGGGIALWDGSSPKIINCLIAGNVATNTGAAIDAWYGSNPLIVNSTIVGNSALIYWGGYAVSFTECQATIKNCLIWGNTAGQIILSPYVPHNNFNSILVRYTDVEGGTEAIGSYSPDNMDWDTTNFSSNPQFYGNGNYSILPNSPCIDKGTPDASGLFLPGFDLAGNLRIVNNRIDIGAYEFFGEGNVVPEIFEVSGGGTFCTEDNMVNIGLSGSQTDITYKLFFNGSFTGDSLGGTGTALNFNIMASAGIYIVMAENENYSVEMSGSAIITLLPTPVVFNVVGGGSYYSWEPGVWIGLDGSEVGINYQLFFNDFPTGLILSGTGASITFGPQTMEGRYTVEATSPMWGCSSFMANSVDVQLEFAVIWPNPFTNLCENTGSIELTGGLPEGGTYSGPGVSNGQFDPSQAGTGEHIITYTFTDDQGNTGSAIQPVTVNALPGITTLSPVNQPEVLEIMKKKALDDERFALIDDFNGDGVLDISTRSHTAGKMYFYMNNEQVFQITDTLTTDPYLFPDFLNSMLSNRTFNYYCDLDNDGNKDLLVYCANHGNCYNNSVKIYWGNATFPYFDDNQYTVIPSSDLYCVGAFAVDFNNDGLKDVFLRSVTGNSMFQNNGNRIFTSVPTFNTGRDIGVNFDDYNGDGLQDLVYTKNGWADGQWGFRFNQGLGNGNFNSSTQAYYTEQRPMDNCINMQANPLINNIPDVIFTCSNDGSGGNRIYVGEWKSDLNNFGFYDFQVGSYTEPALIQSFDYNQDGIDDLIFRYKNSSNPARFTTLALINNGEGSFSSTETVLYDTPYRTIQLFKTNEETLIAAEILTSSGALDSICVLKLQPAIVSISGPSEVCQGEDNLVYSVPSLVNADSYQWSFPSGFSGSSTTNSIVLNATNLASSGIISVKGMNECGEGPALQINVNVKPLPGQASGPINYETHTIFTTGLNVPNQITFDTAGYLYVANHSFASYDGPYSGKIARIDADGNKSVFADGWDIPSGLTIDNQQNLYFTRNNFSNEVFKVDPSGSVTTFTALPHVPGPITLHQEGNEITIFTVSHWDNKGIYKTLSDGSYSLFDPGSYIGCQLSNDGQYLFAWDNYTMFRFNTQTGLKEDWVSLLENYSVWAGTIGPDQQLYVSARSISDSTKNAIFRISGFNEVTEIINNIPQNFEFNDLAFKLSASGFYDLYCSEVAGSRTEPDLNRIIRFTMDGSNVTSYISGLSAVCQGQNNVIYSVPEIPDATSFSWTLPEGVTGESDSSSIIVSFGGQAQSGNITVRGHNECGDGPLTFLTINVSSIPTVDAGPDQTITPSASAILNATATGGDDFQYLWSNGATTSSTTVTPSQTTTYYITITNQNFCSSYDEVTVFVQESAAVTTLLPILTACPGDIVVPVSVQDFLGVASVSLRFSYNASLLTYTGYQNTHPDLSSGILAVDAQNSKVQIGWYSLTPVTIENGTLLEIKFSGLPGTSSLEWDITTPGSCQYTDIDNIIIQGDFINGGITVESCSNLSGNLAYKNSKGKAIIIAGAHAEYSSNYISDNIAALYSNN